MPVRAALAYSRIAEHRSSTIAVRDGNAAVTYAELDDAANQVVHGLRALGVERGEPVAYLGRNCLAAVELMVGGARAGALLTLLNWRLHPRELAHIIADSGARVIVVTAECTKLLAQTSAHDQLVVLVAGGDDDTWRGWLADQPTDPPDLTRREEGAALQLYTSGTTGLPKGVMLTFAGLSETLTDALELWQMDEASVALLVLPLFHIIGVATVLVALWSGGTLVLENDPSPSAVRRFVAEHGVTNVVLVSLLLDALASGSTAELTSLRTISYGGSPISEDVIRRLTATIDCRLVQIYGLSETTGGLTALLPEDHRFEPGDAVAAARLRSCGRARPGVELRIVDTTSGAELPAGQVGEVQARTGRLMAGYWNNPAATQEAMLPDGWLRTGDLGELDADGYLFLRDRLKDMIVSGAENIYPVEVEVALLRHPAVQDVAVVGVPHDRWGETPRALVVLRDGMTASEEEIIAFSKGELARYKCPTSVGFVDVLPRNATGKVLRRVLREPYWEGRERRVN